VINITRTNRHRLSSATTRNQNTSLHTVFTIRYMFRPQRVIIDVYINSGPKHAAYCKQDNFSITYSCVRQWPTSLIPRTAANQITKYFSPTKFTLFFSDIPTLQYFVNLSHMFRSLMGSPSGIRIKVSFHKTKLAMYIHSKKI
jgi:hypothetical protein